MHLTSNDKRIGRLSVSAAVLVLLAAAVTLGCFLYPHTLLAHPMASLHSEGDVGYVPVAAQPLDVDVSAKQAFVYDVGADELLWSKGERRVVYPASITKLWSILCALQYLDPADVVTVGDEVTLIDPASSRAYVSAGQRLTAEMLIEGMLLPSGNDAAYALAAACGRVIAPGAADARAQVAAFVAEMNRYATECGLCGSVFTSPDGLADESHYTTLEDIVIVCRMALQQPIITKYTATVSDHVVFESGENITWYNTNRLLDPESPYYRESVVGLKTGSLDHNYCVIAACQTEQTTYVVGIFGAWDKDARFADACTLIDALVQ